MSNDTILTVVGNATNAELRFTPSGKPVASFSLASTPRHFDRQRNEWADGETMWLNCSAFGAMAENLIETIGDQKSLRVIVAGRLKSRTFETREGEKRTVLEVEVEEVGPSLRSATAKVTKVSSPGGGQQGAGWGSTANARAGSDPWAGAQTDEPPF